MRKEQLLQHIHEKKIVVFGTGERGKRFYEHYKERLCMSYATSNFDDETIENLERVEWRTLIGGDDYFIIVCSSAQNDIAYQLMACGLIYGREFIDQNIAEALLDEKEIVLSVGQCEFEVTNYIFNAIPEFTRQYVGICYREKDVLGINEFLPRLEINLVVNLIVELADYFIYPANLSKERLDYYNGLLDKIDTDCKSVSVPLTTFEAYWPQDTEAYYELSQFYKKDVKGSYPFGGRRDNNLENVVRKKAVSQSEIEELIRKISGDDFYSEDEVYKLFNKTLKKYRLLEKKSDIRISDFLESEYLKQRVFLDRGHASDFVLKEYAKRIAAYLGIKINVELIESVNLDWYNQCHLQQPIYPCVIKHLNFKENDEYQFRLNGEMRRTTVEEYFTILCRYMEQVNNIDRM